MSRYGYVCVCVCVCVCVLLLPGCVSKKSNIDSLKQVKGSQSYKEYTFNSGFNTTWLAVGRVLAADSAIKTIDRQSGVITTDYVSIDTEGPNPVDTALGAKIYKYSHTVTVKKRGRKTKVLVDTSLKMNQMVVYEKNENIPWVEKALRKQLLSRICLELYSGKRAKCSVLLKNPTNSPYRPKVDQQLVRAQKALTARGYRPGVADGLWGPKTRKALKAFQKDAQLAVTGKLDGKTQALLGLSAPQGTVADSGQPQPSEQAAPEVVQPPVEEQEVVLDRVGEATVVTTAKAQSAAQPENMTAPAAEPPAAATTTLGTAKVIEESSLLSGPSFMADFLGEVSVGQRVTVLEKQDEFYKVRHRDLEGYVYIDFVELEK